MWERVCAEMEETGYALSNAEDDVDQGGGERGACGGDLCRDEREWETACE